VLLLAVAVAGGCSSDGGTTAPERGFAVLAPGERAEVILGLAEAGRFRFEARGFPATPAAAACEATPVFFYLYDGVPDPLASLFRYQLMQGRWEGCAGIAVRGYRPEYPGNVFQEGCSPMAWDPERWYAFEVAWDRGTIRTFVDGGLVFTGDYFANDAPLIAAMGWPPLTGCGSTGLVGLEYRGWSFEKP